MFAGIAVNEKKSIPVQRIIMRSFPLNSFQRILCLRLNTLEYIGSLHKIASLQYTYFDFRPHSTSEQFSANFPSPSI